MNNPRLKLAEAGGSSNPKICEPRRGVICKLMDYEEDPSLIAAFADGSKSRTILRSRQMH